MANNRKLKRVNKNFKFNGLLIWALLFLAVFLIRTSYSPLMNPVKEISYSEFYRIASENRTNNNIKNAVKTEGIIKGELSDGTKFKVNIPDNDTDVLRVARENIPNFDVKPTGALLGFVLSLAPMVLFILFLWFFIYRGAQSGGGKIWSFGKSRARFFSEERNKTTFKDVAGIEEAKEEVREVIEFLKDPKKFQRLGGKMPKGFLLIGPPGTGKTLLAKAVAGEAGVPFLSISGSDFVEMFVGVGASRIRDLFDQAKKSVKATNKGCIVFIDEIDAVGRQRFAGIGGGHDEREQTLNALLVEMDGFDTQEGVILLASTNRPDVLDPALLRPGRFDRVIVLDRPDIAGREEILDVHIRNVKLDKDVDLKNIARQTPGFSGADIANLVNEAALLAARRGNQTVTMTEMKDAIERVIAGPEKKSRVISPKEKTLVAYHESGHALLSLLLDEVDSLRKITIIPRGTALGYTFKPPREDRYLITKARLLGEITVALGGRASEEIIFGELTTGAYNDLKEATEIARNMVKKYGMSENLGTVIFGKREEEVFLGRDIVEERDYSEQTAQIIDKEVKKIVDDCYHRAKDELQKNKDKLKLLADKLLEKEVMEEDEVNLLLGLKPKTCDTQEESPDEKKA